LIVEGKEGLDLTDDLATGTVGIKDLIKEAKEGATQAIDAVAAVGALIGLREQARREQRAEQQFQMTEALLAPVLNAAAQGGQKRTESWEVRSMHIHSITTVLY
jgi:hypothetical protein